LHDKKLERCDTNDEYMRGPSNDEDQSQKGHEVEGENQVTMNNIHDRITTSIANERAA
jgi:hypothetical protein